MLLSHDGELITASSAKKELASSSAKTGILKVDGKVDWLYGLGGG